MPSCASWRLQNQAPRRGVCWACPGPAGTDRPRPLLTAVVLAAADVRRRDLSVRCPPTHLVRASTPTCSRASSASRIRLYLGRRGSEPQHSLARRLLIGRQAAGGGSKRRHRSRDGWRCGHDRRPSVGEPDRSARLPAEAWRPAGDHLGRQWRARRADPDGASTAATGADAAIVSVSVAVGSVHDGSAPLASLRCSAVLVTAAGTSDRRERPRRRIRHRQPSSGSAGDPNGD